MQVFRVTTTFVIKKKEVVLLQTWFQQGMTANMTCWATLYRSRPNTAISKFNSSSESAFSLDQGKYKYLKFGKEF